MPINQTVNVTTALVEAYGIATEKRNEFLTPEHLLAGYLKDSDFWEALTACGRAEELETNLYNYINGLDTVPEDQDLSIEFSVQLQELFENVKSKSIHGVDMEILSMGMSGDYAQAIRYGSTLVRIGSGLFGARNYNK